MKNSYKIGRAQLDALDLEDGNTVISGKCVFTKKEYSIVVPTKQLRAWESGVHAQNAMPTVPAEDREFLISGISPEGWNQTFNKK